MPDDPSYLDSVRARQAAARSEAAHDLDVPVDHVRRAMAIVDCELCDQDGYRGSTVCDHQDHVQAAKRGMALVRAALEKRGGK